MNSRIVFFYNDPYNYNGLRIRTEVTWWLLQGTTLINTNDYKSQAEAGQLLAFEPLLQTYL
jgi:hypothetical protein